MAKLRPEEIDASEIVPVAENFLLENDASWGLLAADGIGPQYHQNK